MLGIISGAEHGKEENAEKISPGYPAALGRRHACQGPVWEIDAEEVAWRFLREQTVTHSPTFGWATADLKKLLPGVTAVTREPELKAQTPEELVDELEKVDADQKAAQKRLSNQIKNLTATPSYLKVMRQSQADLGLLGQQGRILQEHQEMLRKMAEPFQIQESLLGRQQEQFEQMQKALRPAFTFSSMGISQLAIKQMLGLNLPSITDLSGFKNPFLEQDWRPVFERVAEAAREADAPEIAEAVEITASEAEKDKSDVDFEAMRKAIEGLTEQLEESNRIAAEQAQKEDDESGAAKGGGYDSFSRQLLLQITLMLIRWMIEAVLSLHFGIPLPPQMPDVPDPSDAEPPMPPELEPPDSLT